MVRLPGLEGTVVAVAGASGGIGASVVEVLRASGARPWNLSVDAPPDGREDPWVAVDVADAGSVAAGLDAVVAREGRLDSLVNAAGITRDRTLLKMTDDEWRDVIDVDLTGAFHLQRAAARLMASTGGGAIVQVTSINGLRGRFGQSNYCAAKAGLVGLVRAGARELGPRGIRVNAVAPGMIGTPMTELLPDDVRGRAREESALGRLGDPVDVAGPIAFLLSDLARHVTGHVLVVDGGQIA